jgi:hypothetical protein
LYIKLIQLQSYYKRIKGWKAGGRDEMTIPESGIFPFLWFRINMGKKYITAPNYE